VRGELKLQGNPGFYLAAAGATGAARSEADKAPAPALLGAADSREPGRISHFYHFNTGAAADLGAS